MIDREVITLANKRNLSLLMASGALPLIVALTLAASSASAQSQMEVTGLGQSATPTSSAQVTSPLRAAGGVDDKAAHKFWDRKNILLHSINTASKIADFHSTERMLRRGGHELNPLLRNRTARVGIILGFGTGGHVLIAWVMHKTGHHRLERWLMVPSIVASSTAAGWNYRKF